MRRNPTAVSGVWLFLLSSLARRNGLLSLRLRGAAPKASQWMTTPRASDDEFQFVYRPSGPPARR